MVLEAPLAAVSSSGVLARDGIHAICAGRNTQPMSELSVGERHDRHRRRIQHEHLLRC